MNHTQTMYVLLEIDATSGKTNTINFTNLEELQSFVNNKSNNKNPTLLKNEIIAKIESLFESLQNTSNTTNNKTPPSIIIQETDDLEIIEKDKSDKDEIEKDKLCDIKPDIMEYPEGTFDPIPTDIKNCLSKLGDNFGIDDILKNMSQNNIGTKKESYCDIRENFFQPAGCFEKPKISDKDLEKLIPEPDSFKKTIENDYSVYDILDKNSTSIPFDYDYEPIENAIDKFCGFFVANYCKLSSDILPFYQINGEKIYSNNSLKYCLILLSRFTNQIIDNDIDLRNIYADIVKLEKENQISTKIMHRKISSCINSLFMLIDNSKIFQEYFQVLYNLHNISKKYNISSLYEYLIDLIVFKLSAKMYDAKNISLYNYFSEVIPYLVNLYFEAKIITEKGKSIQSSDLFSDFNSFLSELFENAPEYFEFYKSQYNVKVFGKLVKEKNISSVRKSSGIFYSDIIYKNTPSSSLPKLNSFSPEGYNSNSFDHFEKFEKVPEISTKQKLNIIKNPSSSIILEKT